MDQCDNIYNIKFKYGNKSYSIDGIDPDRYSYIVLLGDISEKVFSDPNAWKDRVFNIYYTLPGKEDKMHINCEGDVLEMFGMHNRGGLIELLVTNPNDNSKTGLETIDISMIPSGSGTKKEILKKKKIKKQPTLNRFRRSQRLANKGKPSLREDGDDDEVDNSEKSEDEFFALSEDELYALSDDEEVHPEMDDELFSKYVNDGLENISRDGDELSNYESNDEAHTENESDSDFENDPMGSVLNSSEFKFPEGEKFTLLAGMKFEDIHSFRNVLNDVAIMWGFTVVKIKNESKRVTAMCGGADCTWRVHASLMPDDVTFMVKTCNPEHTCQMDEEVRATAKWMAEKIEGVVRADRHVSRAVLKLELLKFGIKPTNMQVYRAKQKAIEMIDGNHGDSYKMLPKYCIMLMRTNPGSVAKIHYHMALGCTIPSIKRFFFGLDASKKGFLAGCPPYIGFDGCHLKGPYGGVLLAAIGMDGDSGIFPLAFAIVESENKYSWLFFFEWLSELLGGFSASTNWTFMSDRQKGLIEAIAQKVPHAVHRKCSMHIFTNFRAKFPPLILRKLFWMAARSYTEQGYKRAMAKMKEIKPEAYDWLVNIGPEVWARYTISPELKIDHITNNSSESFNSWIDKLRGQPVLSLAESLRAKTMSRLQMRYEDGCSWNHEMVPRVMVKLSERTQACRTLTFMYATGTTFEVKDGNSKYIVSTEMRSCDCRIWQLTGIPCIHAVAVLIDRRQVLIDFCDPSLSKETYLQAYQHLINPIPDVEFWPEFEADQLPPVLPPELRRRAGRPKVARRRGEDETPATGVRRSSTLRCARCKLMGHNKRTCAGGPVATKKGSSKKARTQATESSQQPHEIGTQQSVTNVHPEVGGSKQPMKKSSSSKAEKPNTQVSMHNDPRRNELIGTVTGFQKSSSKSVQISQVAQNAHIQNSFGSLRAQQLLGPELCDKVLHEGSTSKSTHASRKKNKPLNPATSQPIPELQNAALPPPSTRRTISAGTSPPTHPAVLFEELERYYNDTYDGDCNVS